MLAGVSKHFCSKVRADASTFEFAKAADALI
jgi:hypothetical protein